MNKIRIRHGAAMRAVELFAGAGGLGIGLSQAGFQPVEVVERDRWCCATIRANQVRKIDAVASWPPPSEVDVRSLDYSKYNGQIDLISGGPPCQPFSLGGKHRANDDERDMWSEAVRAVRETCPPAFIFENVKGLTRETFAAYLSYITLQLSYPDVAPRNDESWECHYARLQRHSQAKKKHLGLQYRVTLKVLNAANYGVPQKRERVVFVGLRSDLSRLRELDQRISSVIPSLI